MGTVPYSPSLSPGYGSAFAVLPLLLGLGRGLAFGLGWGEARVPHPSTTCSCGSLRCGEEVGVTKVGSETRDGCVAPAHQSSVEQVPSMPDVGEKPSVVVLLVDVELQPHPAPFQPETRMLGGLTPVALRRPALINHLGGVDSDQSNGAKLPRNPHLNGVAVDYPGDIPASDVSLARRSRPPLGDPAVCRRRCEHSPRPVGRRARDAEQGGQRGRSRHTQRRTNSRASIWNQQRSPP